MDVRVNSVCPGLIDTAMTAPTFDYARERGTSHRVGQLNPLARYGVAQGSFKMFTEGFVSDWNFRNCQRGVIPRVRYATSSSFCMLMCSYTVLDEASYVTGQTWAIDGGLSSSVPVLPGRWY